MSIKETAKEIFGALASGIGGLISSALFLLIMIAIMAFIDRSQESGIDLTLWGMWILQVASVALFIRIHKKLSGGEQLSAFALWQLGLVIILLYSGLYHKDVF
ncbi:MAG: hypothetical protein NTZ80_00230 [Patescibacteria group bacterium]|nr:hypothetical protein [Patescibacteria group bacterium]